MTDSKLELLLHSLNQSSIEKMDINILKDIISMDIKTKQNSPNNKFKVVFEEVFSFYIVNEEGDLVKKPCFDYTHLNSIGYYKNGVGEFVNIDVSEDELSPEDVSLPNFAVELLNSSMFIEARSIKINDKKFKVGYPDI
ncbi:MAG: hypothetical protein PWQ37_2086 [Candidatus Petromonas sp.]|jgi:hypothetical protein|nr:hypothetical protein [Candidatus Petromonas sp.]